MKSETFIGSLKFNYRFPLWDVLQCETSVCLFSLGCGIGHGYLHRVPTFSAGKQNATFTAPPPEDGFTEVKLRVDPLKATRCQNSLQAAAHFVMKVHLDAVVPTVPTVPTALSSSAPAGQPTPTGVICNVQTGTLVSLGFYADLINC